MYEAIPIKHLSMNQAKNLLKGKGVRVIHDPHSQFKVHMSPHQIKKLSKAHRMGKAMTLTLDPYQQEMHGQGIFGKKFDVWAKKTFGNQIYEAVNRAGKPLLKHAVGMATGALGSLGVPQSVTGRLGNLANAYIEDPSKYNEGPARQALMNLGRTAITGHGIFGDKVDRRVKALVGQRGMDVINRVGRPLVTKGIGKVSQMLQSAGVPASVASRLSHVAESYVDDPSAYQSKAGLMQLAKRGITGHGVRRTPARRVHKRKVHKKSHPIGGALFPAGHY